MTEIEKMKAAREAWISWCDLPIAKSEWPQWLDSEIARLEDPFAQAKHKLHGWSQSETTTPGTWNLIHYVEHLKSERDHYKTQYEHAKEVAEEREKASGPVQIKTADGWREAAMEPIDPKRVLATAAAVINSNAVDKGEFLYLDMTRAFRVCSALSCNAKPYEVQNDQA